MCSRARECDGEVNQKERGKVEEDRVNSLSCMHARKNERRRISRKNSCMRVRAMKQG